MILQSILNYISIGGLGAIFIAISVLLYIIAIRKSNDYFFFWRSSGAVSLIMMTAFFLMLYGGWLIGLYFLQL